MSKIREESLELRLRLLRLIVDRLLIQIDTVRHLT